ncbi:ubiquitin-conjugating enzyme/RWD-like protein, partial [Dipodascopsis tothii]|uniref:ubiquitin-conjugating enzyme/RWD-like protein n=1 Tax=Dipodascopsis tothii TaxID=44089 RepID=UPI0034CF485B
MTTPQAMRRIAKEIADLQANPSPSYSAGPRSDSDLLVWDVKLSGPADSPYANGVFTLGLTLPPTYPFNPPTLAFVTKIYHPNVLADGSVCLPLLKTDQWKPSYKISTIIDMVLALLKEPNGDEAIEESVGDEWKNNRPAFERRAREFTAKYAG